MNIELSQMYHIYNQGNNRETIFHEKGDYKVFLRAVKKYILPNCSIVAYCLMPNHFHFEIYSNKRSVEKIPLGDINVSRLSNGFRLLQSHYAQYFNDKYARTGSLFRQKTKAKSLDFGKENSRLIAMQYIYQNPVKHGLVRNIADWPYSSIREYMGLVDKGICNKKLAMSLIDLQQRDFQWDAYQSYDELVIQSLFSRKSRARYLYT